MKYLIILLSYIYFSSVLDYGPWSTAAMCLSIWYIVSLFQNLNHTIAFREYIMVMFALNYLLSPAIIYHTDPRLVFYKMQLKEDVYFPLAIPGILLLHLGMYIIKTPIFKPKFILTESQKEVTIKIFKEWIFIGIAFRIFNEFLPGEIAFFFTILGGVRFVAAFGLFAIDRKKYKWHIIILLVIEAAISLQQGMFHDLLVWMIFFGMYWFYLIKPNVLVKIGIGVAALFFFYIIQISKGDYRSGQEGSGLSSFQNVALKNINSEKGLFNMENVIGSITRINQAWILASSVRRMDYRKDFQELKQVNRYLEAAILPRVLAPDKLKAGENEIFNQFSGARVTSGTSMGLGFFADGYIAYGQNGLYIFAFVLGLFFALIFKLCQRWGKISPYFILFMFPILNYAVRPDCETQTMMGHLIKGAFSFALVIGYYKKYFRKAEARAPAIPTESQLTLSA